MFVHIRILVSLKISTQSEIKADLDRLVKLYYKSFNITYLFYNKFLCIVNIKKALRNFNKKLYKF